MSIKLNGKQAASMSFDLGNRLDVVVRRKEAAAYSHGLHLRIGCLILNQLLNAEYFF